MLHDSCIVFDGSYSPIQNVHHGGIPVSCGLKQKIQILKNSRFCFENDCHHDNPWVNFSHIHYCMYHKLIL